MAESDNKNVHWLSDNTVIQYSAVASVCYLTGALQGYITGLQEAVLWYSTAFSLLIKRRDVHRQENSTEFTCTALPSCSYNFILIMQLLTYSQVVEVKTTTINCAARVSSLQ